MAKTLYMFIVAVWVAFTLVACSAPLPSAETRQSSTPKTARMGFQLIIKFQPEVVVDNALTDDLSRETGVTFSYVRPISGHAHVFTITTPLSDRQRAALLQTLAKRRDVVYAEEDRRMYPMQIQ